MNYKDMIEYNINDLKFRQNTINRIHTQLCEKIGNEHYDLLTQTFPWIQTEDFEIINDTKLYRFVCEAEGGMELYAPDTIKLPDYPNLRANETVILHPITITGIENRLNNCLIYANENSTLCCCQITDTILYGDCLLLDVSINTNVDWMKENEINDLQLEQENEYTDVYSVVLKNATIYKTKIDSDITNLPFDKHSITITDSYIQGGKIVNKTDINKAVIYSSELGTRSENNQKLIIKKEAEIAGGFISDGIVEEGVCLYGVRANSHGLQLQFDKSITWEQSRKLKVIESQYELDEIYAEIYPELEDELNRAFDDFSL